MFSHTLTARYRECDGQGVVFNARYLAWCDDAIDEMFRSRVGAVADTGWHFMIKRAALEWQGPVRAYDVVAIDVGVTRIGTTSFDVRFRGRVAGDERFAVDVVYVGVAFGTMSPIGAPAEVLAVLRGALAEPAAAVLG